MNWIEQWRDVSARSLIELRDSAVEFMPSLVGALAILLVGWCVAKIVTGLSRRVLSRVGLDRAATRLQLSHSLRQVGITVAPSVALSRLLYWVLMLATVLIAIDTLGLSSLQSGLDRVILYLPNLLAAALILVLGLFVGRLAHNVAGSLTARLGVSQASRLGDILNGLVVLIAVVLALDQVGLQTEVLITLLTVFVGAVGLTMGLALALGARPIVTHILAGQFLRQNFPEGQSIECQGRRGTIERIGSVDTLLKDGQGTWSIPNGQLLEETIVR